MIFYVLKFLLLQEKNTYSFIISVCKFFFSFCDHFVAIAKMINIVGLLIKINNYCLSINTFKFKTEFIFLLSIFLAVKFLLL